MTDQLDHNHDLPYDPNRELVRTRDWTTVQVTALPLGWRNIYQITPEHAAFLRACPAVLLQENHATIESVDGAITATRQETPPYMTRVVYAEYGYRSGELTPAINAPDGDYLMTIGPGEEPPAYLADRANEPTTEDQAERGVEHFDLGGPVDSGLGFCPDCGTQDGGYNADGKRWLICHTHRTRWHVGAAVTPRYDDDPTTLVRAYRDVTDLVPF